MTWLLSALGIGGVGAALFFIPGLLPRAIEAAGALLGVVRRNPWQCAVLALVLACGLLWRGWDHQVEGLERQVTAWKDAQAKAVAWALAEKRAKETAANDITKGANDARSISHTAGNRAGADYKLANQCLRVTPAKGDRQRTDLSRPDPAAGQPSPAPGVALVAVTPGNFDKCTNAALDLDNAWAWGQKLVKAGLAK